MSIRPAPSMARTTRRAFPGRLGLGYLLVIFAAIGYGTLGPLSELSRGHGVSTLAFATGRAALGGVIVLIAWLAVRLLRPGSSSPGRVSRRAVAMVLAVGVLTAMVNMALLASFARTSVAIGLLVFYTYPALVAVASALWLGERLRSVHWVALGLAMLGCVMVVLGPAARVDLLGVGLAFFASIGGAVWVLAARHAYGALDPIEVTMGLLLTSAACLTGAVLLSGVTDLVRTADPVGIGLTVTAAFTSAAVPIVAFVTGVRLIGVSPAAILATLEPVAGVLFAAALLNQVLTPFQLLGGAVVVVAAIVVAAGPSNRETAA